MNPLFNIFGTCLIVLPEWKPVGDMATYDNDKGITLITASNRRNGPGAQRHIPRDSPPIQYIWSLLHM